GALALTTTQRVIHRVLGDTAHSRTTAQPAALTRLADRQQLVLRVADFTDGREAAAVHQSHFGGAKPQGHVIALLRDHLRTRSRGAGELATLPDLELDVVDRTTERDFRQRQSIAGSNVGPGAGDHGVSYREPLGVQDVPLLAVRVHHQRDS